MTDYQAKVEQIIHGHIDLPTSLAETNANIAIAKILALLDQRAVEVEAEQVRKDNQFIRYIQTEARIKALTDVDNLNLLNDSDDWHAFYLGELEQLKSQQRSSDE